MPDLVERLGGIPERAKPATPEALLAAILAGDADGVQRLLAAGVSANAKLPDGGNRFMPQLRKAIQPSSRTSSRPEPDASLLNQCCYTDAPLSRKHAPHV
jgi:hypothetical protein